MGNTNMIFFISSMCSDEKYNSVRVTEKRMRYLQRVIRKEPLVGRH